MELIYSVANLVEVSRIKVSLATWYVAIPCALVFDRCCKIYECTDTN